jgi:hypothetical protein
MFFNLASFFQPILRSFGTTAIKRMARKKINDKNVTPLQTGLAKRMEFYWPRRAHKTRVPLYQNSRNNLVYDHRFKRWLVMWYRHGIQVFKTFSHHGRAERFEKARMEALALHKQLEMAGKLGKPGPDKCMSGVRGVGYDRNERAWNCWWHESGVRRIKIFPVKEFGFDTAYKMAVATRTEKLRENFQFMMQRNRWRSSRQPLGTGKT